MTTQLKRRQEGDSFGSCSLTPSPSIDSLPRLPLAAPGSRSPPASIRATSRSGSRFPDRDSAETPVTGVGLVALPYDRDSVLAPARARAPDAPPGYGARWRASFSAFRGPFTAYTATASPPASCATRSPAQGPARLAAARIGRATARRYAVFGRLTDSLVALRARAEQRAARARPGPRRVRRAQRHPPRGMRQWEDSTYQGYDSLVQSPRRAAAREPVTDTTGADGWATSPSTPGRWWIYAPKLGCHRSQRRVVLEHAGEHATRSCCRADGPAAAATSELSCGRGIEILAVSWSPPRR